MQLISQITLLKLIRQNYKLNPSKTTFLPKISAYFHIRLSPPLRPTKHGAIFLLTGSAKTQKKGNAPALGTKSHAGALPYKTKSKTKRRSKPEPAHAVSTVK